MPKPGRLHLTQNSPQRRGDDAETIGHFHMFLPFSAIPLRLSISFGHLCDGCQASKCNHPDAEALYPVRKPASGSRTHACKTTRPDLFWPLSFRRSTGSTHAGEPRAMSYTAESISVLKGLEPVRPATSGAGSSTAAAEIVSRAGAGRGSRRCSRRSRR